MNDVVYGVIKALSITNLFAAFASVALGIIIGIPVLQCNGVALIPITFGMSPSTVLSPREYIAVHLWINPAI